MPIKRLAILALMLSVLLAGCGSSAPAAQDALAQQETPTLPAPSDTPEPTDTPTPSFDVAATQSARLTADVEASVNAAATRAAETRVVLQASRDAKSTAKAVTQAAATAAVEAKAAAREDAYRGVIQKLFDEGKITTTKGEYIPLENYEENEARINTPFIYNLGYDTDNFMISSDLTWSSASDNANWPTSGCGFLYGYKDRYTADLTFLGLDGFTHSLRFRPDKPVGLYAYQKWGEPDRPKGQARARLLMFDKRVTVYVNDQIANEFFNSLYSGGELGLSVFSGTNKDYGTRCYFKNIELFLFD
jgi:hypothetical protein